MTILLYREWGSVLVTQIMKHKLLIASEVMLIVSEIQIPFFPKWFKWSCSLWYSTFLAHIFQIQNSKNEWHFINAYKTWFELHICYFSLAIGIFTLQNQYEHIKNSTIQWSKIDECSRCYFHCYLFNGGDAVHSAFVIPELEPAPNDSLFFPA